MVRPGKKLREGVKVDFGDGLLHAEILEVMENGDRLVHFEYDGIFNENTRQNRLNAFTTIHNRKTKR